MKTFLKTVIGIVLFVVLATGLLTALRNYIRQPSIVITDPECDPPCWNGIYPGVTRSSEVFAILQKLKGVDINSLAEHVNRNGEVIETYWYFQRPIEDSAGSIYFENDRVIAIKILTVNSLKITDIFNKLGQPNQYWAEVGQGENREFLNVALIYPSQGYLVEVVVDLEGKTDTVKIKESTPIFSVTYFNPALFQELLKTDILIFTPPKGRMGSLKDWPGLGDLQFTAP